MEELKRYSMDYITYKLDAEFAQAVYTAADAIEALVEAQRWIPVGERLPEKYQSVLAARQGYAPNKQHYVCEAWLNDFNWQNSCGTMENVTHWQALPQPPQKGE